MSEVSWGFEFEDVELGTFESDDDVEPLESPVETSDCSWGSWRSPRRIYRHASACRDAKEFLYG